MIAPSLIKDIKIMNKPKWMIQKEHDKKAASKETFWLFGTHAVEFALLNVQRQKFRLIVTKNAYNRLEGAIKRSGVVPKICDARKFSAPLDSGSVHQGAALEVKPLVWGSLQDHVISDKSEPARLVLLDQITDPHNVGAILRSAEIFGVNAVVGTLRNGTPETGALAKSASGSLERQPYLRIRNLANSIKELQGMGFYVLGLDGTAKQTIDQVLIDLRTGPFALVFGAEGHGLRENTKNTVDGLASIPSVSSFGSLNVSNAVAVSLYATRIFQNTS